MPVGQGHIIHRLVFFHRLVLRKFRGPVKERGKWASESSWFSLFCHTTSLGVDGQRFDIPQQRNHTALQLQKAPKTIQNTCKKKKKHKIQENNHTYRQKPTPVHAASSGQLKGVTEAVQKKQRTACDMNNMAKMTRSSQLEGEQTLNLPGSC